MTASEFDALTVWGPAYRPPRDWDGATPYLRRDGWMCVDGWRIRAYQISDGTRVLNHEDLERYARSRQ